MGSPNNGIYIIQGEISLVVTAMRRSSRWNTHSHHDDSGDPLFSSFSQLKDVLNNISDLIDIEPNTFLSPFLEVIRSEDTTGPITGLALTSVNKFLSYGLVDPKCEAAAPAIENIADAVTHARFVGTDPGSDEVVLMKILHVLRTLLLAPAGVLLTNESVCEIMQSCFRICFEMRLSELLRKSAEHTLMDMVQMLFCRLPHFKEDPKWSANMKKLKMRTGGVDQARMGRNRKKSSKQKQKKQKNPPSVQSPNSSSAAVPTVSEETATTTEGDVPDGNLETREDNTDILAQEVDMVRETEDTVVEGSPENRDVTEMTGDAVTDAGLSYVQVSGETIATTPVEGSAIIDIVTGFQHAQEEEDAMADTGGLQTLSVNEEEGDQLTRVDSTTTLQDHISLAIHDESLVRTGSELSLPHSDTGDDESASAPPTTDNVDGKNKDDFINPRGVRFIPHQHIHDGSSPLIPYGLPCVRELFRFLISLTNPLDRHNTDVMIHMGLSLLTVALESGADHIGQFSSLVFLVKDDMCRYLFLLVQSERLSLSAAALRVCFLLFESMRSHLKLQLEMYLLKLSEIITSDHPRITYETRELALESIVQLWRIPGLVTELYLNYDCDLYCTNLFEDLTKLLSKNAFPVAGLFSTHLLSLDALLTVVDTIEQHCHSRILKSTSKPGDSASQGEEQTVGEVSIQVSEVIYTREESIVGPPSSGFDMGNKIAKDVTTDQKQVSKPPRKGPYIKPNRMKITAELPSTDKLMSIKQKKRVYQTGTDYFNAKAMKGLTYLQEQGLLSIRPDPPDREMSAIQKLYPDEVVTFIKENPKIDKKMVGEFIGKRECSEILEAFVKSFHFKDLRIDEALRQYLEAFRLPGEAPVIGKIMECFANHWHISNGDPFFNNDAAFTLAYAVIMLNVDQHNHNVKKQNIPMTVEQFKKNLTKTNGGENFESEMLEEIYVAIKTEEIVMPSEHTGLLRENYMWKVILNRSNSKEGLFTHAATGVFDHDLFTLIWGPTVAALSFVFDKSSDEGIISKAISGFRKCAMISAHYGMSDVFDNLVISLCKFTTLLSSVENPETIPISFGMNMKAQLAARTVFNLAHRHGDILREGWKNILDCMLHLYKAKLLPKSMIEVEDFVNPANKICLVKEENLTSQRSESGVLGSLYSYFTSETPSSKGPSPEEEEATRLATKCIGDCHLEQLITDSKFLREESLHELVKALIFMSQGPDGFDYDSMGKGYDEDNAVFFFEQFITCILQNRDRVSPIWQTVRDHIYSILVNATEHNFFVERAVVGLLRISIRLLRREEIAPQVLTSVQILLMMKPRVIHSMSQQIAYGLHDLLRTNAANIHSNCDWYTLFVLLEVVGAGASPPPVLQVNSGMDVSEGMIDAGAQSDSELPSSSSVINSGSDRGYTSDSELETQSRSRVPPTGDYDHRSGPPGEFEVRPVPDSGTWMFVNKDEQYRNVNLINPFSIELNVDVHSCDCRSLLKSSETLSFLIRDAAHVTPLNFESCVHALRAFAEASLNGGTKRSSTPPRQQKDKKVKLKQGKQKGRMRNSHSSPSNLHKGCSISEDEAESEGMDAELHSLSIQLLDLMHTLHTRANSIYKSWAEEEEQEEKKETANVTESLWIKCWCPLLQGIARLCCDARRQVRGQALTYLQRALLVHDLQTLSAVEWEACFNKILFPLLTMLLDNINPADLSGMEETRMRASTLLCKVFLQHLSPLLSLSTFTALWLTILDFMDKYMHVDRSDLLTEAIPENLKNMLLVMDTAAIFQTADTADSQLWRLTWDRIGTFLPHLKDELFKSHDPGPEPSKLAMDREAESPSPASESSPLIQGTEPGSPTSSKESPTQEKAAIDPRKDSLPTEDQSVVTTASITTAAPSSTGSLATDTEPPTATSYFLHTPLPSAAMTTTALVSQSGGDRVGPASTAPVPLLLDPELMKDGSAIIRGQPSGDHPDHRRPIIVAGSHPAGRTSPPLANYPMNRVHDI